VRLSRIREKVSGRLLGGGPVGPVSRGNKKGKFGPRVQEKEDRESGSFKEEKREVKGYPPRAKSRGPSDYTKTKKKKKEKSFCCTGEERRGPTKCRPPQRRDYATSFHGKNSSFASGEKGRRENR